MSASTNINKVYFNGKTSAYAERVLYQWDYGQVLQFPDLELPAAYQVHFSTAPTAGSAYDMLGTADGVSIPDTLLEEGKPIYAWIFLHAGEDDGETVRVAVIYVKPRSKSISETPTPAQQSAWDEAISALSAALEEAQALAEAIPEEIDFALAAAKKSGEFDGADGTDGNCIWWTTYQITSYVPGVGEIAANRLRGRSGTPAAHDLVVGPAIGQSGSIEYLYEIISVGGPTCALNPIGSIKGAPGDPGEDGFAPEVTIEQIEGGHRVTITSAAHPEGESFDVMNGSGGSGSSDYNDLSNKPQIAGVTLSGNKSLADLGIAAASDIPTVPSAYTSTPADLGTASAGSSTSWAKGDHVHKMPSAADVGAYALPSGGIPKTDLASAVQTSLGKADTALQSAPVTSVNGQTGAVTLSIPSTASDVGAVAANQGVANANKVLTVGSNGMVSPEDNRFVVTLTPTAQDFSGVMDKTCAEITAAYEAGKDIWLNVDATAMGYDLWRVKATIEAKVSGENYGQVMAFLINLQLTPPSMIFIFTEFNASGDENLYTTQIYPLASGQWTGGSY